MLENETRRDAEIAEVKTGLFWQNRAYGHPGPGSGSKGWRVCACTRLWVRGLPCATPRGQLALEGVCSWSHLGSLFSPRQSVLFSARIPAHSALPAWNAFFSSCRLSPLLYYIPPGVSPHVLCGSGSRNLPFQSTPTSTLCPGVFQAVNFWGWKTVSESSV